LLVEFLKHLTFTSISPTESFRLHYGPGVNSAFNKNEYCGYLLRWRRPVHRPGSLAIFICRFSRNFGNLKLLEP